MHLYDMSFPQLRHAKGAVELDVIVLTILAGTAGSYGDKLLMHDGDTIVTLQR